ncbi:MAG TPA: RecX family transcriptional regulator [Spirochaetia bacterium]|nr:RecX family transcriptional regulator [Spirochaetia bacterium]
MVRIHLADGSFFVVHAEVFATEGIAAGTVLDGARIEALTARSQQLLAREAALRLLSRAAQTRRGLTRKLRARGFSQEAAGFAVKRMAELGYLDDRAYAENWARFRISTRKEGWKSLYRGLVRNGVSRAIAEEVLAAVCTEEVELEGARRLVHGLAPKTAVGKLTSRGFRSRTIARILSEMKRAASRGTEE